MNPEKLKEIENLYRACIEKYRLNLLRDLKYRDSLVSEKDDIIDKLNFANDEQKEAFKQVCSKDKIISSIEDKTLFTYLFQQGCFPIFPFIKDLLVKLYTGKLETEIAKERHITRGALSLRIRREKIKMIRYLFMENFFWNSLSKEEQTIVLYQYHRMSVRKIEEITAISKSSIQRKIKRIKEKWDRFSQNKIFF